ncbi:MAG: hypothetical protein CMI02_08595 [Oceanospirillaceae bacterium]|nr:hypothetical protein [Oceanospirillaceae bacterium]
MLVLEEGWVYLKNSKPVQLTEQWLIDFGFEKYTWCDDCAFIKINRTFLFVRKFKGKWICQFRYIKKDKNGYYCGSNQRDVLPKGKLKDVHQIQNLYFALTGKELIKL